jgi:hypothetical protein
VILGDVLHLRSLKPAPLAAVGTLSSILRTTLRSVKRFYYVGLAGNREDLRLHDLGRRGTGGDVRGTTVLDRELPRGDYFFSFNLNPAPWTYRDPDTGIRDPSAPDPELNPRYEVTHAV